VRKGKRGPPKEKRDTREQGRKTSGEMNLKSQGKGNKVEEKATEEAKGSKGGVRNRSFRAGKDVGCLHPKGEVRGRN